MSGGGLLGLIVALPEEARALARVLRGVRQESIRSSDGASPCRLLMGQLGGRRVVLVRSGAGAAGAARGAAAALERGADTLLAVGFAGSLSPAIGPGELLIASEVVEPSGACWPVDGGLLRELQRTVAPGVRVHCGRLLTAPRVVAGAEEKRRLGEETGALGVDMESASIARCAARARVPLGVLRAITDGAGESLPPNLDTCFDSAGQFHRARLLPLLVRRPAALRGLLRLGHHSGRAGSALATYLRACFCPDPLL
jgi:adenosylhomocysteine nucleosidase